MLQSGQLTSQQNSRRLADVSALRSTISSSGPPQLNANCHRSWDLARPLSPLCPRLSPSTSLMNGTRTRGRPGCKAWRYLWLETGVWSWMVVTQRKEISLCSNTSNSKRTVNILSRSFQDLPMCHNLLVTWPNELFLFTNHIKMKMWYFVTPLGASSFFSRDESLAWEHFSGFWQWDRIHCSPSFHQWNTEKEEGLTEH